MSGSLQSSGPIRFSDIRSLVQESGKLSLNSSKARTLFRNLSNKTTIRMSQGYGKSKYIGYICGSAGENLILTMSVPEAGTIFNRVDFASYGTPNGVCGGFSTSGCHSTQSVSVIQNYFLNKTTGVINVLNSTFLGDPCPNVYKALYVQLSYGL